MIQSLNWMASGTFGTAGKAILEGTLGTVGVCLVCTFFVLLSGAALSAFTFLLTGSRSVLVFFVAFIPNALRISGISLSSLFTSATLSLSLILREVDQLSRLSIPTTILLLPFLIYIYMVQGANRAASGCAFSLSNILYENSR